MFPGSDRSAPSCSPASTMAAAPRGRPPGTAAWFVCYLQLTHVGTCVRNHERAHEAQNAEKTQPDALS